MLDCVSSIQLISARIERYVLTPHWGIMNGNQRPVVKTKAEGTPYPDPHTDIKLRSYCGLLSGRINFCFRAQQRGHRRC